MPVSKELATAGPRQSIPRYKPRATLARCAAMPGARLLLLTLAASGVPAITAAQGSPASSVIYVDQRIPDASCDGYKPAARTCAGGHDAAVKTLAAAAARAAAGTTVLIREGTYHEPLVPGGSGTLERPIVFRNFEKE